MIHLIFKKKEDVLPVSYILAVFTVHMGLFFFVESPWLLLISSMLLIPFLGPSLSFAHNHSHYQTFRVAWVNRVFEHVLFFESGATPYAWVLHHNLGHHANYLDRSSDSLVWERKNGRPMSRFWFDFYNAIKMYPEVFRIGKQNPNIFRRFKRHLFISIIILLILSFINPLNALIVIIFPVFAMLFFTADGEYPHHIGINPTNHLNSTKNILNRTYNYCYFNLGYHTAHHIRPSLHWSELPGFHENVKSRIPKSLLVNAHDMR